MKQTHRYRGKNITENILCKYSKFKSNVYQRLFPSASCHQALAWIRSSAINERNVWLPQQTTTLLFCGWCKMCVCLNRSCVRSFAGCADLNLAGRTVEEDLVSQVQWRSMTILFSLRQSVISRVYTSRLVTVRFAWNLDRSGTKKVSGTRYSTQWKNPPKVNRTVPYRAVPCSGKAPLHSFNNIDSINYHFDL